MHVAVMDGLLPSMHAPVTVGCDLQLVLQDCCVLAARLLKRCTPTAAVVAMQEVQRRGVAEAGSIAVGGHSYGAYMVGNLMAHCPDLFACGIARSGAYNRYIGSAHKAGSCPAHVQSSTV